MNISVWVRVIRVRFLLASVIAVSVGLSIQWWQTETIDFFSAILTYCGVLALHASVDLLNDYWDFKRGIDSATKKTKMSGGTGVLPEGLLKPSSVYGAGVLFLVLGGLVGAYFVFTHGVIIAILLAFAIISIYFYSTKIVNSGLGEFFVAVKGTMIVLGTYFIQTNFLNQESVLAGIFTGILSSLVLFITSFPDYEADKTHGRRTLVIVLGKQNACHFFWVFPILVQIVLFTGVFLEFFPFSCLIALATLPLIVLTGFDLRKNQESIEKLIPSMSKTLTYSRITGSLFVLGFLIASFL